jgi:hypothetical protein
MIFSEPNRQQAPPQLAAGSDSRTLPAVGGFIGYGPRVIEMFGE